MHFTVLSALPLPQDTSTAMNAVTVDDVVSFVAGKLLLENLASQKPVKMPEVDSAMIDSSRWECLVECMVDSLLAPYNENNTDIAHMEFDDHTDEGHTAYEQSGVDCVKTRMAVLLPVTAINSADGMNCMMARSTGGALDRCITASEPRNRKSMLHCPTTRSKSSSPHSIPL